MKPSDVAKDALSALQSGGLPKWYDMTMNQAKRVWELLRKKGVNNLGVTRDPNGGYWVRKYEDK